MKEKVTLGEMDCYSYTHCRSPLKDLPSDSKVITVLAKQMGKVLLMKDYSYISKTGES
ncbi:hypothetical protein ACJ73_07664, partial [Blastomyces percursus]